MIIEPMRCAWCRGPMGPEELTPFCSLACQRDSDASEAADDRLTDDELTAVVDADEVEETEVCERCGERAYTSVTDLEGWEYWLCKTCSERGER